MRAHTTGRSDVLHARTLLAGVLAAAVLAAIAAMALAVLSPDRDPHRALARRHSPVVEVLRQARPDLGARIERWRIVTAAGDTLQALWRGSAAERVRWTVVLLGGIGTDERAALIVPPGTPAHVLAMSWPWRGPRSMSVPAFLAALPAIREACLRAPAVLAAGVEAAARETGGPPARVAVLGASLGAPPAIAAMSLSRIPAALVLVDAGAPLGALVRHELNRQGLPPWLAAPAARTAAWLLAPLEPHRHAATARSRRALLFSARREERLPPGSAERLHALLPHARVVWRDGAHIRPHHAEAVGGIARAAVDWLESER